MIVSCRPPGPQFQVVHDLTPPATAENRFCTSQCSTAKKQCLQDVDIKKEISQERCEVKEQDRAQARYAKYVRKRLAKGKKIRKKAKDFFYGYRCRSGAKQPANYCVEDYHQCYTSCGGQVATKSVCVANCDQIKPQAMAAGPATSPITTASTTSGAAGAAQVGELAGKWGATAKACAPTNDAKDGVVAISPTAIQVGLTSCTVASIVKSPDGMTRFDAQCRDGEDQSAKPEAESFYFSLGSPGQMIWDNRRFKRKETLVRCSS